MKLSHLKDAFLCFYVFYPSDILSLDRFALSLSALSALTISIQFILSSEVRDFFFVFKKSYFRSTNGRAEADYFRDAHAAGLLVGGSATSEANATAGESESVEAYRKVAHMALIACAS